MSRLGRVALACCVLGVLASGRTAAAPEEPLKSNLDVMGSLATGVVEELVSGFPSGTTPRDLRLAPAGRDERYEFIGNILARSLTSKGYHAYVGVLPAPSDSTKSVSPSLVGTDGTGIDVEYQLVDFTLRYPKVYRPFLIGGKKVKRSADVRVLARLVDPGDGLVVWTGEAKRSYDDTIPYGLIDEAEAGLYQFAKPPHESRNWGKVIEPVAVTGIIVGLIYLFFSNQGS